MSDPATAGCGHRLLVTGVAGHWGNVDDQAMYVSDVLRLKEGHPGIELGSFPSPPGFEENVGPEIILAHHLRSSLIERGLRKLSRKLLRGWRGWPLLQTLLSPFTYHLRLFSFLLAARLRGLGLPVSLLPWKGLRQGLSSLAHADGIFHTGAGSLNSIWPREQLYPLCALFLAAHWLGKSVVCGGQTIGPLDRRFHRWFAGVAFRRVGFIAVRDPEYSAEVLESLKVPAERYGSHPDDAVALPPAEAREVEEALDEIGLPKNVPVICVSIHWWLDREEEATHIMECVVGALSSLLEERPDLHVLFVPMQQAGEKGDFNIAKEMQAKLLHPERTFVLPPILDARLIKGIAGRGTLALTTRYHMGVLACSMEVPAVGLYYDEYYRMKLHGALQFFGCGELALDALQLSAEKLRDVLSGALDSSEQWHERLRSVLPDLRQRADEPISRMLAMLGPCPSSEQDGNHGKPTDGQG